MWPIILTCLVGCFLAAGSVWLYEIEHTLTASDESTRLGIAIAPEPASGTDKDAKPPARHAYRRPNRGFATDPSPRESHLEASIPIVHDDNAPNAVATADFRNFSDAELVRQALALEAELRVSENKYHELRFVRRAEGKAREMEFRRELLPQAISLANEIVFRLGTVEVPSDVRSLSIKLGAAVVASGEPAGAIPMSPVAKYLIFLTRKLRAA